MAKNTNKENILKGSNGGTESGSGSSSEKWQKTNKKNILKGSVGGTERW